jgi:hypothetical protein
MGYPCSFRYRNWVIALRRSRHGYDYQTVKTTNVCNSTILFIENLKSYYLGILQLRRACS